MSEVSARCKTCRFRKCPRDTIWEVIEYCDYMLMTGERRGCSAGDECDKYIEITEQDKIDRQREFGKNFNI